MEKRDSGQRTHPSTRSTSGEPSGLNQALFLHPPALPSTGCGVPSISWDCHSHSWEETRGHPPSSDIPQMVNKERLPALPSEHMARSFHRAPSTENDYGPPTALAPGRRHCFSDMPGTLPAILGQNHRMAGPQESACLKGSNPPLCCPRTGPGGSLGMRFTRQLLDLITRQSTPHLEPSTLAALHCRKVTLADFSATPSPLADTGWEPTSPASRCTSRITV